MQPRSEIINRVIADNKPIVASDNIQDPAQRLMHTNLALAQLVIAKCNKIKNFRQVEDYALKDEAAAIKLIITGIEELEVMYEELKEDDEDIEHRHLTPAGSYYSEELAIAFRDAEEELLVACWNKTMLHGGWTFTSEGTPDPNRFQHFCNRDGWLVKGTERISVDNAIDIMVSDHENFIDEWIHFFTKTIYLNTTTEEWVEVLQLDPTDHELVDERIKRVRRLLIGI